jgi:hypothetical protein
MLLASGAFVVPLTRNIGKEPPMLNIAQPVYFIHNGRVVRGRIDKRHRNHVVTVEVQRYVLPDGTEHPVPLNFKRKIGHEETTAEAAPLLAALTPPHSWSRAKRVNAAIAKVQ